MTDNSNPFVLPGMGQGSGDMAGNPLLASMEMMRKAWAGLTGPGGLAQALPMTAPLNLEDLERRISELRSVESWLRMNLSMLGSTIQGMEVQRATIATLRSFVDNAGAQAAAQGWPGASPLEVALGLKPAPRREQAESQPESHSSQDRHERHERSPAADTAAGTDRDEADRNETDRNNPVDAGVESPPDAVPPLSAGSAQAISHAAQSASEAWWSLLQQQFGQIAAATAATMPGAAATAQGAAESAPTSPGHSPSGRRRDAGAATKSTAKGASPDAAAAPRRAARTASKSAPKSAPKASKAAPGKTQSGPDKS